MTEVYRQEGAVSANVSLNATCNCSAVLKAICTLANTINLYMVITLPVQNFDLFSEIISSMDIFVGCELIESVVRVTKNI